MFEDLAAKYLEEDEVLQQKFEQKKQEDEDFANNAYAQLEFIYKNSNHYESTHSIYPVARLVKAIKLETY